MKSNELNIGFSWETFLTICFILLKYALNMPHACNITSSGQHHKVKDKECTRTIEVQKMPKSSKAV